MTFSTHFVISKFVSKNFHSTMRRHFTTIYIRKIVLAAIKIFFMGLQSCFCQWMRRVGVKYRAGCRKRTFIL